MAVTQVQICSLLALVSLVALVFEGPSFVQLTTPHARVQAETRQAVASQKGLVMEKGHADVKAGDTSSSAWRMMAAVCAAVLVALLPLSVGVGPMIAPPMYGSPFLGPPMGLFGPPLLIPGPSFGPSPTDRALQDQQQHDERLLDSQKMQIESLQREITDLKAKKQ